MQTLEQQINLIISQWRYGEITWRIEDLKPDKKFFVYSASNQVFHPELWTEIEQIIEQGEYAECLTSSSWYVREYRKYYENYKRKLNK